MGTLWCTIYPLIFFTELEFSSELSESQQSRISENRMSINLFISITPVPSYIPANKEVFIEGKKNK